MSLQDWSKFGWLKSHRTDLQELSNLLADYVDGASKSEAEELLTLPGHPHKDYSYQVCNVES